MAEVGRARVLLAILVYNGRPFVPAAVESAARLHGQGRTDVEVLVLDDCSPEPGWSLDLEKICDAADVEYYRSPRNLGIPRNMNLALLRALHGDYDYVVLCNSDVVLPLNVCDALVRAADDPEVGSVTAWSNNVSIYSLENAEPDRNLAHVGAVDFVSAALEGEFGTRSVDIPTAVGFCMLIPVEVIRNVGLLDPVFGRGYCEEVDWCLRSHRAGFRSVLGISSFVYHVGNGTTREAGLLERGQFTSWANEAIIDMRYPDYRDCLASWAETTTLGSTREQALRRIVACAAREWGYSVEASWLHRPNTTSPVQFVVEPDGPEPLLTGRFQGFKVGLPIVGDDVLATVERLVGTPPSTVSVLDRGRFADRLESRARTSGISVVEGRTYPERV